jgi:hypothetical protein
MNKELMQEAFMEAYVRWPESLSAINFLLIVSGVGLGVPT